MGHPVQSLLRNLTTTLNNYPEPRGRPLRLQDLRPRARDPRASRVQEPLLTHPRGPGEFSKKLDIVSL